MFPEERTKPPTDSWENPVGEANTGLIGPDMGGTLKVHTRSGLLRRGGILNVETIGTKRTFKLVKLHLESIEFDI